MWEKRGRKPTKDWKLSENELKIGKQKRVIREKLRRKIEYPEGKFTQTNKKLIKH